MLFLVNFELGNIVEILALAATTIGLLVSLYTARKDRKIIHKYNYWKKD